MQSAWLFDGRSAERQPVTIRARGGGILIEGWGGEGETVDAALFRHVERRTDAIVLSRQDRDGWRLGLPLPLHPEIAALLPRPERYGRWIDRIGLGRAALVGLAASATVLFLIYQLPALLAPLIPDRVMQRYGEVLVGDFGGKFCAGPGGQQALDVLTARLAPEAQGIKVRVVDLPVVNAAALPGGNIVIFEELLAQASSAEEFAGILGHEIAHVDNRDVAEAMIRELGLGLVVTTLGGNVGGNAHSLLSMRYSRDAEREADAASIAAMLKAGISPAPTARFFERLAKDEANIGADDVLVYLSTHPAARERGGAFREAAKGRTFTPALSRDEWEALVDICHNDPARRKG